ncbi:MAG: hypothetical protein FWB96_03340 [Defluviitaleaceae bacterium]|nr:hypothetical protein [Defluviitaleaceae bacterium]MCL2261713.1 hypothetical protein [Defluviitaleaceae bacterium]
MSQKECNVLKTGICVLLFPPIWFLVYAFFHEAAHALLHIAYGGTIESFVFWTFSPHVRASGTQFTPFAAALNRASGELLTTFLAAIAIGFYNSKIKFTGYHFCYFAGILSITAGNLWGWVVIPIRSLFTLQPWEDVTHFLDMTDFHPAIIAMTAFLLTSAFLCFAYAKGVFTRAINEFNTFTKREDDSESVAVNFKTKPGIVSLGLVFAAILTFITAFYIPYEPPYIFNISTSITDVREEKYFEYTFIVEEAGLRPINSNTQGRGFITGVRIFDTYGDLVFASVDLEYASRSMTIRMNEGVYRVSFSFLTDFEAAMVFYAELGIYDIEPETIQNLHEIFNRDTDDFSVAISFRVR